MALKDTLASFKTPVEHDTYLAKVWKDFTRTEAYEALVLVLSKMQETANASLLAPGTEPYARAHAAGIVFAVRSLATGISSAAAFDPSTATYEDPSSMEETDDVPPDTDQLI